jgi:hypothetical protein
MHADNRSQRQRVIVAQKYRQAACHGVFGGAGQPVGPANGFIERVQLTGVAVGLMHGRGKIAKILDPVAKLLQGF